MFFEIIFYIKESGGFYNFNWRKDVEDFDSLKEAILKRLGNIRDFSNRTIEEKVTLKRGIQKAKNCNGILYAFDLVFRFDVSYLEFGDFIFRRGQNMEEMKEKAKIRLINDVVEAEVSGSKTAVLNISDYFPLTFSEIGKTLASVGSFIKKSDRYDLLIKI